MDGTLVDTVGTRIDGWLAALAAAGMRTTRVEVAAMIGMDGKRLARDVAEANHRRVTNDEIEEIDRAAGEAFDRLNTSPQPLPGVGDLLAAIEARGLRWVIATSSRAEQVTRSVAALGVAIAPTIVDGSQVKRAKPCWTYCCSRPSVSAHRQTDAGRSGMPPGTSGPRGRRA